MTVLDTTVMIAIHDKLRRDMEQVARRAADPNGKLDSALGWEFFARYLDIHHRAEDDLLWPMLIDTITEGGASPDDLGLVESLEADHQMIDPMVEQAQAILSGQSEDSLHDLVDDFIGKLGAHLDREESEGLPMMARVLSEEQWAQFSMGSGARIAPVAANFLGWLLNDASNADVVLDHMPPPMREGYVGGWRDAYAELSVWP